MYEIHIVQEEGRLIEYENAHFIKCHPCPVRVQSIFIGISMTFLIADLFRNSADYSAFPLSDQIAYFTSIGLRVLLVLVPPILTIVFISRRSYKLTITFMSLALFFGVVFFQNFLVLLHIFMLLTLLLHKPSKMYLKQESSREEYNQKNLRL